MLKPLGCVLKALGAVLFLTLSVPFSPSFAEDCILIDSDADLDDFRAIATLASTNRIAAVVVTEGIARAKEGAGAVETFLAKSKLTIPVVVGASADPQRDYNTDPKLSKWRSAAEQLNGTLLASASASSQASEPLVTSLRSLTSRCSRISLLVIGPWTSFLQYAPMLLPKIYRITVQGRPYPDELGGEPEGFNCRYDHTACLTSFDLLVGRQLRSDRKLRAEWVDIPNGPERCASAEPGVDETGKRIFAFSPTIEWANNLLQAGGTAAVVGNILRTNPEGWSHTSLWDDLAALYLLRPELFVRRGGHFEPCVSANVIRNSLTEAIVSKK
jgi:hypothetical protein